MRVDEFRLQAREWLEANAPRESIDADLQACRAWQAKVAAAGFAAIAWPKEFGGVGLTAEHDRAFNEEAAPYELPTEQFAIGFGTCGPALLDLATDEQKRRHLPPLVTGEHIWCQLFSEPGSGSDLAGARTKAVHDGDHWVINGQKIWTSRAHFAQRGMLLARTDPQAPKHAGLSMFVVDMQAPGVTVRPLRDMTGGSRFNEVFFDDLIVPDEDLITVPGGGWTVAFTMLKHERLAIGSVVKRADNPIGFENLARIARRRGLLEDGAVRSALTDYYLQERALSLFGAALQVDIREGREVGARGSVAKLATASVATLGASLAARIAGESMVGWQTGDDEAEALVYAMNMTPAAGLVGGTTEIQRTLIGERVLGLPKENR